MKLPKWLLPLAWILSVIAAGIGGILFTQKKPKTDVDIEREAQKIKEETYEKIKNTPADTLVSDADNASDLRAERGRIASEAKQRLRDRAGKVIQRFIGADTDRGTVDGGGK